MLPSKYYKYLATFAVVAGIVMLVAGYTIDSFFYFPGGFCTAVGIAYLGISRE